MAYACDVCQSVIRDPEALAVLRGWYGCEESRAATAKKEAEYRQISLDTEASLERHICLHCVETVLAKEIRLSPAGVSGKSITCGSSSLSNALSHCVEHLSSAFDANGGSAAI